MIKKLSLLCISTLQTLADRYTMHMHGQLISSLSCLVSCVHQFFQLRLVASKQKCCCALLSNFDQAVSAHRVRFSTENTMPMCCLCIPMYLIPIRVATLPGTLWTGPRIQRTRIDAILKENPTIVASSGCPPWKCGVAGPRHIFSTTVCHAQMTG